MLDGRGVWGRMDISICVAESLCCPCETITALLIFVIFFVIIYIYIYMLYMLYVIYVLYIYICYCYTPI